MELLNENRRVTIIEIAEILDIVAAKIAARERLLLVLPHIRYAISLSSKTGSKAALGILEQLDVGGGRVVCQFGIEMIDDIALMIDAPAPTQADKIEAAAQSIVDIFCK